MNDTPSASRATQINPTDFRNALGHYASGLTVITGTDVEGPTGFTCQSFYSVSVEPPLVSFSVKLDSTTYPRIRSTGSFAVNVMSESQQALAGQFARRGTDKWDGVKWYPTTSGNPVIDETHMWLDCTIWAEYEAGDHYIVVGQVHEMSAPEDARPLIYYKGAFRLLEQV